MTKDNSKQAVNYNRKKTEKDFKGIDETFNSNLNFCFYKLKRINNLTFNAYKNFCEHSSCGRGCFLKFLKLSPMLQDIIWNKFGSDNYLGEIKEMYFEKLFTIFKFDPCGISLFFSSLDSQDNIDYNVSCFSVGFI